MTGDAAERIRVFAAEAVSPGRLPDGAVGLIALGWATVELDRAVAQLATELGVEVTAFVPAASSAALGSLCLVADGVPDAGLALAVIEPATEGRIAAALARWDEGPVVAWYAAKVGPTRDAPAGRPGPFGPERILAGDPLTGPHRLLVAGASWR